MGAVPPGLCSSHESATKLEHLEDAVGGHLGGALHHGEVDLGLVQGIGECVRLRAGGRPFAGEGTVAGQ